MENKAGHKTSEFYATMGTIASLLLMQVFNVDVDPAVLATIGSTVVGYVVSRGVVKKGK